MTAEMLTDHRLNTNPAPNDEPVCGMCCGAMMPDTRLAYETFLSRFNEFLATSQTQRNTDRLELLTLIADLRGILASEPVGYLQNQIDTLSTHVHAENSLLRQEDAAIKSSLLNLENGTTLSNASKIHSKNIVLNNLQTNDFLGWNGTQFVNFQPSYRKIFQADKTIQHYNQSTSTVKYSIAVFPLSCLLRRNFVESIRVKKRYAQYLINASYAYPPISIHYDGLSFLVGEASSPNPPLGASFVEHVTVKINYLDGHLEVSVTSYSQNLSNYLTTPMDVDVELKNILIEAF